MRGETQALSGLAKDSMEATVFEGERVLALRRWSEAGEALAIYHFGDEPTTLSLAVPPGTWRRRLDSADERWLGPGCRLPESVESTGEVSLSLAPQSVVLALKGP